MGDKGDDTILSVLTIKSIDGPFFRKRPTMPIELKPLPECVLLFSLSQVLGGKI